MASDKKTPIGKRPATRRSGSRHIEFRGSKLAESFDNTILLPFSDVPEWSRDNEYITHGYRRIHPSILTSFQSWFYLHNETMNIFTHLIPSILAVFLMISLNSVIASKYPKTEYGDYLILNGFFATVIFCLAVSGLYHTLICHSQKVEAVWLRMDFLGIIILTMGIFFSAIVLGFKCHVNLQRIYCTMTATLGFSSMAILLSPRFQGIKWRTFRTLTFVGFGFSGFGPLTHGIIMFGFSDMLFNRGMAYWLGEGVLFLLGVFFYITRIPECLAPGRFNIFGSSHQIFHSLVVISTLVHLTGIIRVFEYNYFNSRVCLI